MWLDLGFTSQTRGPLGRGYLSVVAFCTLSQGILVCRRISWVCTFFPVGCLSLWSWIASFFSWLVSKLSSFSFSSFSCLSHSMSRVDSFGFLAYHLFYMHFAHLDDCDGSYLNRRYYRNLGWFARFSFSPGFCDVRRRLCFWYRMQNVYEEDPNPSSDANQISHIMRYSWALNS